ncbi:hypothetical protein NQZ68_013237 [Dissostichus eleginoides]|nr:hypothetical protein NQZ68_013237 [Dissostichus eleginoides]
MCLHGKGHKRQIAAPRFKGYQQQDSQELLHYLLDSIRVEETKYSEPPSPRKPFTGQLEDPTVALVQG